VFRTLALVASFLLCLNVSFSQNATSPPKDEKADAEAKAKLLRHPLDPLTEDEIKLASKLLLDGKHATRRAMYSFITLTEPKKEEVLAFKAGNEFDRKANATFYEPKTNETFFAVVNITRKSLESKLLIGKQSVNDYNDSKIADRLLRVDPRWIAAVKKRGLDPIEVDIYGMSNRGYLDFKSDGSRYVLAVTSIGDRVEHGEVPDLRALINVTKRQVIWIRDGGGPVFRSDPDNRAGNEERLEPTRPAPKPLKMTQPEGASFTMEGNEVKWQNWRFRIGADPRVGLVLYTVGYEDGGKVRSILYRASLSELFVPYGDPSYFMVHWFDAGEFGMNTAFRSSFVPNNDAPEYAKFLSVAVNDGEGKARMARNSIALYEQDGGILWRHGGDSRRSRQLVLAMIHQAGNYDYNFKWIFHQDGTLEQQTDLSGYMETRNVARASDPDAGHAAANGGAFGTLVAPNIEATNHQHFFSFRLDMDVDGQVKNQLIEMNVGPAPDKINAQGNGIFMTPTLLKTEDAARRNVNMASHRCWVVSNPAVKNKFNQPSAYMLIPGETGVPYSKPESFLRKISGFTEHQLWATPYDSKQLYSAGDYVQDGSLDDGLPIWTKGNRSIEFEDVVLYYTVGVTHIPRIEDWPMMSAHHAGFKLVPAGFFSSNPGTGVPPVKGG
jgi:primary-amine oxidase